MKIVLLCPPLIAPVKSWRYCPYHIWKFSFAAGDHGYSGVNMPICMIGAYLRKNNIPVDIVDAFFENLTLAKTVEKVIGYDLIGITVHSNVNIVDIRNLVRLLRKSGFLGKIVLGGHYPSYNPEASIKDMGADFVIRGEGELPMLSLVECLSNNSDLRSVKGLTFKTADSIVSNEECNKINELDELPMMAREYIEDELRRKFVPAISSSRGCSYADCLFCDIAAFQKTSKGPLWRARSPKNVVDEIEYITKKWNFNKFNFVDPHFIGGEEGKARAIGIADEIIRRNLKVNFMFDTRVDDIDEKLFIRLYQAGLKMVYLGIESCVPRQLKYYNKKSTPEENTNAIETLRKIGITPLFGIIAFEPTATISEIRENYEYFVKLGGFNIYRFVRGIIPRVCTPLMARFKDEGRLIEDYPDYRYKFDNQEVELLFKESDKYAQTVFLIESKYKKRLLRFIQNNNLDDSQKKALILLEKQLKDKTIEQYGTILSEFETNKEIKAEAIESFIRTCSAELDSMFKKKLIENRIK